MQKREVESMTIYVEKVIRPLLGIIGNVVCLPASQPDSDFLRLCFPSGGENFQVKATSLMMSNKQT